MYERIAEQCGNVNGATWEDAKNLRAIMCRMVRDQYAVKRRRAIPSDIAWTQALDDAKKMFEMAQECAINDASSQLAEIAIDNMFP